MPGATTVHCDELAWCGMSFSAADKRTESRDPLKKILSPSLQGHGLLHTGGWTEELRGRVARLLGSKLLVSPVRKYPQWRRCVRNIADELLERVRFTSSVGGLSLFLSSFSGRWSEEGTEILSLKRESTLKALEACKLSKLSIIKLSSIQAFKLAENVCPKMSPRSCR